MKASLSGWASGLAFFCFLANHANVVSCKFMPRSPRPFLQEEYNHYGAHQHAKRQATGSQCAPPGAQTIQAPKSNIWAGLTEQEAAEVTAWLHEQLSLNLTAAARAGDWDNAIRYAHVILDIRASEEPYYQSLLVGPLPVGSGNTRYEPLDFPFTKKSGGRIRALDDISASIAAYRLLYTITASIADITQELWNGTVEGKESDVAQIVSQYPLGQDDGITQWFQFLGQPTNGFEADTLLPLGLYFSLNITGRDPNLWKLQGWYYNGVFYETTEDFKSAFAAPGFEKLAPNVAGQWTSTDQTGEVSALDDLAPPMTVAPSGSRYSVDEQEKYVKWMDFEFYIAFSRDTGVRLFDIKYRGERIIYELGLEEALAHYAGNDPVLSGIAYLDSWYGFGSYSFQLVAGYDCPEHATYLNTTYYNAEIHRTHINSICLFETTADYPIQRHSASRYVSVTKNVYFTLRNICTVGNYDYMFSYSFYMDGSVHVEVRASGYIQSAYWAHNGDYGHQIHDALSGAMHDHVLNFKLDLDVAGTANTLTTTTLVPTTEEYPWAKGKPRNTMKLQRGTVSNEAQGKLNWAPNDATQYTVVNLDARSPYGEPRGYRIAPSSGAVHLTVENSTNLANAANWATHDLFVTKRKDTEPRSAAASNGQDVHAPLVDFNDFFDGEDLVQEDLVVWFNLGMHHVPHTGDLPNTVFTTAHSGLTIMPLNYLGSDPSRTTPNQVRINYSRGATTGVEIFGQDQPTCSANLGALQPNLNEYSGDVAVRKYPFDPANPHVAGH
ncbi:copper amine oxidase [Macrophomina phaseolina]|uniref:Amine oxidase n=1 Tax=Macrophomina phaseolina TaxID=35725 RepID=A0ABQ8GM27_9PEZI|nr:copper amine oxidase [Macrophomina phaseolina]